MEGVIKMKWITCMEKGNDPINMALVTSFGSAKNGKHYDIVFFNGDMACSVWSFNTTEQRDNVLTRMSVLLNIECVDTDVHKLSGALSITEDKAGEGSLSINEEEV